jgi:hypothetical protein
MKIEDVKKCVAAIEAMKDDDESAHDAEAALYASFIQHVAETAGGELAEMAREVLKTSDIEFARWCA